MNLDDSIVCPVCSSLEISALQQEEMPVVYNGKSYTIQQYFYKCPKCGDEYTTTETDEETLSQIPNSIWSKDE